jgi:ribokinase
LIFVGADGENCIGVGSGANAQLMPADVRKAKVAFADASVVIMQLETPIETIQAAADLSDAQKSVVILNPAPAQRLSDKLLKKVSILTPNETETELLTGVKVTSDASCRKAVDILLRKGVKTVIITLGSRGAFVGTATESQLVPGFKVKQVDTTAAGDTFNGALAVALAEGMPMIDAVWFANAAGALSVTRMGAQPSVPTRREIEKLLSGKKLATNGKLMIHGAQALKPKTRANSRARVS